MAFPSKDHQWKPGQSGNPGGRPKGTTITAKLARLLDREATGGKSLRDALAEVILREALKGDPKFIAMLWDRLEGKVPDKVVTEQADDVRTLREFLHGDDGTGPAPEEGEAREGR